MTISSAQSASILLGNGVTSEWTLDFVPDASEYIYVTYTNASGTETVLTSSQYTITINPVASGQIWASGFTLTYPISGAPIANGTSLTVQRILPLQQLTSLQNQGNFYPQAVEAGLDTLEMQIQQVSARGGSYRGVWATDVIYNFGDIVQDGINGAYTNNIYVCAIANTSGTWATDLAAGDWSLALNIQTINATGQYLPLAGGTISGNLGVTGTTTLSGNATVGGTLGVTGATTLASTLGVTGATTLASTLGVTGATTLASTLGVTGATTLAALTASSLNGGQFAGFRNRIINGDMRIDQRNAGSSQTITAAASAVYTVDRMYATCTGANVTGQRVAGSGVDQYVYQFTGASSVTAIAFGQRIEATNIYDQESGTVTLGVKLANSLLTTVTWTAYYPASTDTWTSRTQISTGTFTVTSTLTKYSASISLPSNVTTGLEIELSVGAQISGTWTITEFQVESGSSATPFERIPIQVMLAQAQRYYYSIPSGTPLYAGGFQTNGFAAGVPSFFPVTMRIAPTISNLNSTLNSPSTSNISPYGFGFNWTSSGNFNAGTYYYNASAEL